MTIAQLIQSWPRTGKMYLTLVKPKSLFLAIFIFILVFDANEAKPYNIYNTV